MNQGASLTGALKQQIRKLHQILFFNTTNQGASLTAMFYYHHSRNCSNSFALIQFIRVASQTAALLMLLMRHLHAIFIIGCHFRNPSA
jgi:hypothetical protein